MAKVGTRAVFVESDDTRKQTQVHGLQGIFVFAIMNKLCDRQGKCGCMPDTFC